MKKAVFLILPWMILFSRVKAQSLAAIIEKYKGDTTGFTAYPDAPLLANLNPAIVCTQLEINTWAFAYRPQGDKQKRYDYKNLCRFPTTSKQLPDTAVLTKAEPTKSFTACLCPDFYPWYISAQTKDGRLLTIGDTLTMKWFINKINDQFSALLWFHLHDMHADVPQETSHLSKYKKVSNGFLLSYNATLNTSPLTTAWLTYLVSTNFEIILISTKHIVVNPKISYKI